MPESEHLAMTSRWVQETETGPNTQIWHLDGLAWHEAAIPRRLHRCRPQTHGLMDGESVERCACGAIRMCRGYENIRRQSWFERNSRRGRWMAPLGTNPSDE